jgi:DNA polymerase III delta prime subunit
MQNDFSATSQAGQVIQLSPLRESMFDQSLKPFADNFDHLQALELEAKLMVAIAAIRNGAGSSGKDESPTNSKFPFLPDNVELEGAEELLRLTSIENRLREELSIKTAVSLNFLEFCSKWELDSFESLATLLLFMQFNSPSFMASYRSCGLENNCDNGMEIGALLTIITHDLRKQLECRRYFGVKSKLIKDEILNSNCQYMDENSSILRMSVYLHERNVRYILGDNNHYHASFSFMDQEKSDVSLAQVVLPGGLKEEVLFCVDNFLACRRNGGMQQLDSFFGYGTGLAMLFHGPSGTGKTMLAKGLANHLGCQIITLNLEALGEIRMADDDILRYIFKEASLLGSIVFLDECDDLLATSGNSSLNRALLLELERSHCITILATNRPVDLDPAMERRLALKVRFTLPDEQIRKEMWHSLTPENLPFAQDVDTTSLAKRYLFTGGLVKNSIFLAASAAIAANSPVITKEMIEEAAIRQTSTLVETNGICRIYSPVISIDDLQLRTQQKEELRNSAKAWKELYKEGLGFNILISAADISTAVKCAEGLANDCGLKIRAFDLEQACSRAEDNKIFDPVIQKKVNPIQYAFAEGTGDAALLLFVDHSGIMNRLLGQDDEKLEGILLSELNMYLRGYKGLFCLITKELKQRSLPAEFNLHYQLEYPPESLQINHWEKIIGLGMASDDELVRLAEEYPMHISEIEFIGRQSSIKSIIKGRGVTPSLECIQEIICNYRHKSKAQLLFGRG